MKMKKNVIANLNNVLTEDSKAEKLFMQPAPTSGNVKTNITVAEQFQIDI
jgi:hypothetical protein